MHLEGLSKFKRHASKPEFQLSPRVSLSRRDPGRMKFRQHALKRR